MESTLACTSDPGSRPSSGHNDSSYFIASFKLFLATVLYQGCEVKGHSLSQGHTARRSSGWARELGSGSQELQESLPFPPPASSTPSSPHQLPSDAQSPDPPTPSPSLPPEAPPLPLGQRHVPPHPPAPAHCLFPAVRMRRRRSALRSVSARGCGGAGGSNLSGSSLGGGGRGSVDASSAS